MKYDIKGMKKSKIIDHYKIKENKNKRYNIYIYFRDKTEPGRALNYPYEDMIDLKKTLDSKMHEQMSILLNCDIARETFSLVAAKKSLLFTFITYTFSIIIPIVLSIIFSNFLNLLLMPILLKITNNFKKKYEKDVINDEFDNYSKYQIFFEHHEEFEKTNIKNLNINTIDSFKVSELKKLKEEILELKRQKVYTKK